MHHVLNAGFAKQDVRFVVSVLLRGLFIVSVTSCAAFCNILSGWLKLRAHPWWGNFIVLVAADRSGAWLCCVASPWRSLPDACGFDDRSLERLERPSSNESPHQTLFSSFLFGPANCFILRLTPTPCFSLTSTDSLSLSALTFFPCAFITMCVFYRLCALSHLFFSLYLFFLSLPPCLSSVSFLVSCFVKEIAFVLFDWRPEFSAESVSLQASSWWWTATNIAPCDWEFTPGPEKRDHLALFPNWCSKPCCLVSASLWFWQRGNVHLLLITKGGANITPCHSHMTLCNLWDACWLIFWSAGWDLWPGWRACHCTF